MIKSSPSRKRKHEMPPKKTNAFMIFTTEWKSKYGRKMTMAEATQEAGKYWEKLTPQERGPYNEKAKNENLRITKEKLTSTGVPISLIEKEKKEQEQKLRTMRKTIEKMVEASVKRNELSTQKYFFVMINYFAKTLQGKVYLPAEISVCEYSLKDGLSNKFHSFINPGINIYGHTYEAQAYANETHQLPLPPNAMGEENLGKLYNSILEFIKPNPDGEYPPLFTHRDSVPIVESAINFLKADSNAKNVNVQIYSIQYLFYSLKLATCEVGEIEKPSSHFLTDAYFERDIFEYMVGIACKFHEDRDKSNYCTLSCITRWCYTFSDYMASDIAIKCIPGRHLPINTRHEASASVSAMSDTESFVSMGSESTYVTKALSENKVYYDEQKSVVSNRAAMFKKDDFPDLIGKNRKKVQTKPAKEYREYLDKDLDYTEVNRWAERSRRVAPQPDESHFNIDLSQSQSNKVTDLNDRDDTSSVKSFGRGRHFRGGFGRGNLLHN